MRKKRWRLSWTIRPRIVVERNEPKSSVNSSVRGKESISSGGTITRSRPLRSRVVIPFADILTHSLRWKNTAQLYLQCRFVYLLKRREASRYTNRVFVFLLTNTTAV